MAYTVEVRRFDENEWSEVIRCFKDATIYQTHAYGSVRWGSDRISHLVLLESNRAVAAAQVTIQRPPFLKCGIAYVPWGPLWRRQDRIDCPDNFRHIIQVLRDEIVLRRKLMLRIRPQILDAEANPYRSILLEEGYKINHKAKKYRTLLLNLEPSLDAIRRNFEQKWRNQLNRAEKNNLEIIEGSDDALYSIFLDLVFEMTARKGFEPGVDYREFQKIQRDLSEPCKMRIFICRSAGQPVACAISSALGDTGIYMFGATSDSGMQSKGSYLLQWRMIQWLRSRGCRWYDLGGVNPEENPGVYHFKQGCAGKSCLDVHHLGQYEFNCGRLNRIFVYGAETSLKWKRGIKNTLAKKLR